MYKYGILKNGPNPNNLNISKNYYPFPESSSKFSSSKTCDFIDAEYQANIICGCIYS